jgi:acyl-CoA reductase-like NAD-dependent aldehyde dehydrogenase
MELGGKDACIVCEVCSPDDLRSSVLLDP